MTQHIAYVSNADSGDIHVFELDVETGTLSLLEKVPSGGVAMPLAVSPDHRFLFVANRLEPHVLASFRIDPQNGRLGHVASTNMPYRLAYIATDRSGRFLLGASYSDHKLIVSAIDSNSAVNPPHQIIDTGPHAHAILADPANRYVLASSLGSDVMMQYRFDAVSGRLTPNEPPTVGFPSKSGPRHFVFHPNGRFVYVINELDATVSMTRYDSEKGTLAVAQTLPLLAADFHGKPWAAEIRLTPDGRLLYTSERTSSSLAAFAIDAETGRMSEIGRYATEAQPRGFNIDPTGRFLLCVGQESNSLSVHRIEPDGALSRIKQYPVGMNPTWVEIIALA